MRRKILELFILCSIYLVSWVILIGLFVLILKINEQWITWPLLISVSLIVWLFQVETLQALINILRNKNPHWFGWDFRKEQQENKGC
jgi:hypothetical protein